MTGLPESHQRSEIGGLTGDPNHDSFAKLEKKRVQVAYLAVLIALCAYWALLFYGTHSRLPPGVLPGNSDKLIHCVAYAGLGGLLITLRALRGRFCWTSVAGRWMVLAVYGAIDELTQVFVNRSTDLEDWYADLIGAAFGLGIVTLVVWYFRREKTALNCELASSTRTAE